MRIARLLFCLVPTLVFGAEPQSPTWPQQWTTNNREPAAVGFAVTRPGAVLADVQSEGAPVTVMIINGVGKSVGEKSGNGAIQLSCQVQPADVQSGPLWQVAIVLSAGSAEPAEASGSVSVRSPPADDKAVVQLLDVRRKQLTKPDSQAMARAKEKSETAARATMARFQQGESQRRAALFERIRPQFEQAQVQSRGLRSGVGIVLTIPPPPSITGLSVASGRPIDPVRIAGTGFSESQGEVRFVTGPDPARDDHMAPVTLWHDGEIYTSVPDTGGVGMAGYNGFV